MRIKDMITLDESNWYFNKFSPPPCIGITNENFWILMLGFEGLTVGSL